MATPGPFLRHRFALGGMILAVAFVAALALRIDLGPPSHRAAIVPGLTLEDAGTPGGIIVTSVETASSADRAGVVAGDRITAIDGRAIASLAAARAWLGDDPRAVIDMRVEHDHSPYQVKLARWGEPPNVAQDPRR